MKRLLLVPVLACLAWATQAGAAPASAYQPLQTFGPFAMPSPVNRYRSSNGLPGPDYWQNRADYTIKARLDPDSKTLTASEDIGYTNRSPDELDVLWLQLDQNLYKPSARGNFTRGSMPLPDQHTDGYRLSAVQVEFNGKLVDVHYVVSDTRMRIDLPQPLAARGGHVRVHIDYHYTVPGRFGGRTGWIPSKNGDLFDIAQWFPRLCVYDDLRGWDTAPYLNNEFYLEYGSIDYSVTVPADMIVVGSGKLVNADKVLSAIERKRLAEARKSDATVMIRTPAEVTAEATRPVPKGEKTWHFHMDDTRDVAFAASRAYVWDAARIKLPHGRAAMAMSVYPVESVGPNRWSRSTQFVKHSVEIFSRDWYPYPYSNAVSVAGVVGGMEYPGLVFDSWKGKGEGFFALTAHEIGHTWFPMVVGSNERRHAWMDEGFNTFIDVYVSKEFNHGEFSPKSDPEYAPRTGNPAHDIVSVLTDPDAPPIMTRADMIPEKYRHPVTYFKAAYGLVLLREQILGRDRFDPAFRRYIAAWAYKHPSPSDFFRAMDSAAGEDLSWFWREWFAHNWKLDMAVTHVGALEGGYRHGAVVTVANLDRMVMPATLQVTYDDGTTTRIRVPVETWMQHHHFEVIVPGSKPVVTATIDPDQVIPDVDRSNNRYRVK